MDEDFTLPERPDLKITVGDQVIKMTYGLEMDIRRMLPDPATALALIQSDPFTQDYIVRRILTNKKAMITDLDQLISMDEVDIEPDDADRILSWATEHALYFFVKRTVAMAKLGSRYQQALPKLSTAGSENLVSTTPSAGVSE
jgi:hypothetical protein